VVRDGEGDSPWNNYYYKNKSLQAQSDGLFPSCQVRKRSFEPFIYKNAHFTKTGSGQT
jgi:hypothetical protein